MTAYPPTITRLVAAAVVAADAAEQAAPDARVGAYRRAAHAWLAVGAAFGELATEAEGGSEAQLEQGRRSRLLPSEAAKERGR